VKASALNRRIALLFAAASVLALACGERAKPAQVVSGGLTIAASLEPEAVRVGENRLELELRDAEGRPVEGADVAVKAHMHSMGAMPAMGGSVPVKELGDGRYAAEFELSMGGTWLVEIEARPRAGAAPARAEGSLTVGVPGLELHAAGGAAAQPGARETAAGGPHPAEFALPPGRVQEIGVRSTLVERKPAERSIRALGRVAYDETALADVSLKVRGWIGELRADAVGARVERGDVLFTLYSPELYAAQEEYLQALRSRERAQGTGAPDRADWRVEAARRRLALWDVGAEDLASIERRGTSQQQLPIRSPASGFVVEKSVVEGSAVEPGARLLRIVPLDRVWVEVEVYESEAELVREGMPATVEPSHLPGRRFEGRVAYVYPMLSEGARTLRARVELPNPELALRPGMWANVRLLAPEGERLLVPQDAVLHAGERAFVFLDLGGGRFRPQRVELGMRSGDAVEVRSGLEAGQRVVASGTFLIAAESRLRAALDQW
jgi:Cu(I)/Ag(I) efflux system membrane fusion protein